MSRTPVGAYLKEELHDRGLSQCELARQAGLRRTQVNDLARGARRCTPFLAVRIARVLGVSPEFLLNLQMVVDLHRELKREEAR